MEISVCVMRCRLTWYCADTDSHSVWLKQDPRKGAIFGDRINRTQQWQANCVDSPARLLWFHIFADPCFIERGTGKKAAYAIPAGHDHSCWLVPTRWRLGSFFWIMLMLLIHVWLHWIGLLLSWQYWLDLPHQITSKHVHSPSSYLPFFCPIFLTVG